MKLKKLLMLLLIPALLVTMMVMSVSAEEAEEDYLWNLYDLNFDEFELDLIRFNYNFGGNYAKPDGTLRLEGLNKGDKEVNDVFHTQAFEDLKLSVVTEVKFKTNAINIWITNLTNQNTMTPGYNVLINRDGILCLNKSANPLTDKPVNDGEWHVVRTILLEDETLTIEFDGEEVYSEAADASSAGLTYTEGGFARFNIVIISSNVVEEPYLEIDYIRIGDGERGVPTTETEPAAPETTTPATDNNDNGNDDGDGTTDAKPNDGAVSTGDAQGTEKEPMNIGVIIGIVAAVIVVVAVVVIIIKKRK